MSRCSVSVSHSSPRFQVSGKFSKAATKVSSERRGRAKLQQQEPRLQDLVARSYRAMLARHVYGSAPSPFRPQSRTSRVGTGFVFYPKRAS